MPSPGLVHFPDDRWMMVDGGPPKGSSNSGRIAADFLAWKMFVDQSWRKEFSFGGPRFILDSVVIRASGGLFDCFAVFDESDRRIPNASLQAVGRSKRGEGPRGRAEGERLELQGRGARGLSSAGLEEDG